MDEKPKIEVDYAKNCIIVEHIGITLRTLLAVGAEAYQKTGRRKWNVSYKGVVISSIRVRTPSV